MSFSLRRLSLVMLSCVSLSCRRVLARLRVASLHVRSFALQRTVCPVHVGQSTFVVSLDPPFTSRMCLPITYRRYCDCHRKPSNQQPSNVFGAWSDGARNTRDSFLLTRERVGRRNRLAHSDRQGTCTTATTCSSVLLPKVLTKQYKNPATSNRCLKHYNI